MGLAVLCRYSGTLASTTLRVKGSERSFIAIYVTYYIKVQLITSGMYGDVSVKIPFVLMKQEPREDAQDLPTWDGELRNLHGSGVSEPLCQDGLPANNDDHCRDSQEP